MSVILTRLVIAAAGGALVFASFPPVGLWPAAIVGLALLVLAVSPVGDSVPRTRTGVGVGFVFGFVFFMMLLPWVGL